ncbi:hypothetical protein T11_2440 [Trichinella zimbabwensis]|uniref:Uncharacterized protein n=1 Tax=Trichinella zimbabwensis TaxID=268475 RepID=A0A0V1HGP7_9BILA|nr:hypothetical protein T11_2440 [Trichinella zimbabwensis]
MAPSRKVVEASSFHEAIDITLLDIVSIGAPFVNYPFPFVGISNEPLNPFSRVFSCVSPLAFLSDGGETKRGPANGKLVYGSSMPGSAERALPC